MLVGRERERERIRGLVAAARVGESGALVLRGEAGIGKSALLEDAVEVMSGMSIVRATGSAAESEVPFGGLLQVLRPALVHLGTIPGPQADALASALALRAGSGGTDRFAIGAATLSLLSRLAEDQPVAVLIDDAHLLDRPSAQALAFAARRRRDRAGGEQQEKGKRAHRGTMALTGPTCNQRRFPPLSAGGPGPSGSLPTGSCDVGPHRKFPVRFEWPVPPIS